MKIQIFSGNRFLKSLLFMKEDMKVRGELLLIPVCRKYHNRTGMQQIISPGIKLQIVSVPD